MADNTEKSLLICEYSDNDLQLEDNKGYVLEGIFAELNVKNRNNRIYEEDEYIPQIENLKESIDANSLLGELDHPESFDIKLKNASHIIENVWYDKKDKTVRGRIRLLDTNAGRQAKALVDSKVPLHISSRAAGVVENEKVKFKNLVTFDLVSTPGFKNARLHSLNESFGLDNEDNMQLFEVNNYNENKYEKNMDTKFEKEGNSKFVTEEEMQKYSEYISEMFEKLKNEKESGNQDKVIKYTEHIAEKLNNVIKYLDYFSSKFNESEKEKGYLKDYVNMLGETLDNNIKHNNYLSEMLDKSIKYTEHIAEGNGNENVNNIVEYLDYVAETFNENEKEKEKLKGYVNYLSEMLDNGIKYSESIAEENENIKKYSNYLAENIKNIDTGKVNENNKIQESNDVDSYKKDITSKIDGLIKETANNKKAEFDNKTGDFHFLRFLNEEKSQRFQELNEGSQDAIIKAFRKNNYYSKKDAQKIWESVTGENESQDDGNNKKPDTFKEHKSKLDFIQKMPRNYVNEWRNSTQEVKNRIIAESTAYDLSDEEKIKEFWESRDFRDVSEKKEVGNNDDGYNNTHKVNENKKQDVKHFSNDPRIQYLGEEINRKFNK